MTLASHAPKYFEEHMETVVNEDGTKEKKMVIDSYKRSRFEKKLTREIAKIAGVSTHHITIDEVKNRDTGVGYYQGKEWIIGTAGEFKSKQEKYIEEQEKADEEIKAKQDSNTFEGRMRSASDMMKVKRESLVKELEKRRESITLPALLSPSKKKQIEKEGKEGGKGEERRGAKQRAEKRTLVQF